MQSLRYTGQSLRTLLKTQLHSSMKSTTLRASVSLTKLSTQDKDPTKLECIFSILVERTAVGGLQTVSQ